jgi:glycopeptide antibiotics resistance protein
MGRPFWDTVTLYMNQTGSIGSGLNYNSSSMFAFFPNESAMNIEFWSNMGVVLAFTFMLAVLLWLFIKRKELNREIVLAAALLLSLGIPFILPHMHDRYFFVADVVLHQ